MATTLARDDRAALALPGLFLVALLTTIGLQTGVLNIRLAGDMSLAPETTTIAPRTYSYRAPGDFVTGTTAIDGPLLSVAAAAPLEIMTYQVSAAEYARCVAEGACQKAEPRRRGSGDVPATGVSFDDATDYAAWLSAKTGATWRLPTVAEWAFAAGSRATDPALRLADGSANPAERWLAAYEREAELGDAAIAAPGPRGTFGVNEYGVADLAGSVWEWTATCSSRTTVGPGLATLTHLDSCGVRLLEGRHRTLMSAFVRDAKAGGCSAGRPPDNLGFRLVRDRGPWEQVITSAVRLFDASTWQQLMRGALYSVPSASS